MTDRATKLSAIAMELARQHTVEAEAEWLVEYATLLAGEDVTPRDYHIAIGRVQYALRGEGRHGGRDEIIGVE